MNSEVPNEFSPQEKKNLEKIFREAGIEEEAGRKLMGELSTLILMFKNPDFVGAISDTWENKEDVKEVEKKTKAVKKLLEVAETTCELFEAPSTNDDYYFPLKDIINNFIKDGSEELNKLQSVIDVDPPKQASRGRPPRPWEDNRFSDLFAEKWREAGGEWKSGNSSYNLQALAEVYRHFMGEDAPASPKDTLPKHLQ